MNNNEFQSIRNNLVDLLNEQPKLRNEFQRYTIIWEYWKKYDNLAWGLTRSMWTSQGKPKGLTKYTALERVIREIFKGKNDLKQAEIFRKKYAKSKTNNS